MAGLLQRRRGRASIHAQQECFVCGHPVLADRDGVEIEGRVFHDTCLHGPVEGRTYSQLYGERTGDVTPTDARRRKG